MYVHVVCCTLWCVQPSSTLFNSREREENGVIKEIWNKFKGKLKSLFFSNQRLDFYFFALATLRYTEGFVLFHQGTTTMLYSIVHSYVDTKNNNCRHKRITRTASSTHFTHHLHLLVFCFNISNRQCEMTNSFRNLIALASFASLQPCYEASKVSSSVRVHVSTSFDGKASARVIYDWTYFVGFK